MTKRTCAVEACERPHWARGWCEMHYDRWKKNGDTGSTEPNRVWRHRSIPRRIGLDGANSRVCAVDGCDRQRQARDWCKSHWARWRRTGDVGTAFPEASLKQLCSFADCGRVHYGLGLCVAHWQQRHKGRPLTSVRPRVDTTERDEQGRKECQRCSQWLPEDSFYSQKGTRDGLQSQCRRCHRDGRLIRSYGVDVAWYDARLAEQGGGCAICGSNENAGRLLVVDHDHSCCPGPNSCGGCVRAILCDPCNRALGLMADTPERLEAAATYLRRHARE